MRTEAVVAAEYLSRKKTDRAPRYALPKGGRATVQSLCQRVRAAAGLGEACPVEPELPEVLVPLGSALVVVVLALAVGVALGALL